MHASRICVSRDHIVLGHANVELLGWDVCVLVCGSVGIHLYVAEPHVRHQFFLLLILRQR